MTRKQRHYYNDNYRYYPHRRGGGFFNCLKRFIYNTVVTILCIFAGIVIIALILLAYIYRTYLGEVLLILLWIGGVILGLLIVRVMIKIIAAIVNAISAMRIRAIEAGKAKVELSQRRLERDAYQQRLRQGQQAPSVSQVHSSRSLAPPSDYFPEPLVRRLPPEPAPRNEVSHIPQYAPVYYHAIRQQVRPGQLVALIRPDGSLRLEGWNAFKILLVLGGSSSGKTTTIAEKVLGFVNGGGLIVPCDPHDSKEDSLFNKISPLSSALYPGAVFAVDHPTILQNMRLVNAILEDRINGGESTTPVLLVVEELNRLLRDKALAKEISVILEALGEEGRGYNVFVLVGCQRVTGLSDIRKAFISFIIHRCDESEAQLLIPSRYAKHCSELRPGHCFVKDSDAVTEFGRQALVTRQDMEQASMRLSSFRSQPISRKRPGQLYPTRPFVPSPSPEPQTFPRAVHKTRLRPIPDERQASTPFVQGNPLHTWSPSQEAEKEAMEDRSPLFDVRDGLPAKRKDTEELSSSHLNADQQLELLALLRKKEHQKKKEN